ncbi:hypothetical protein F5883DRAFT_525541 [Diaporthe sp. PMI_573]|nr:hypothetical protein F5883DRAFT_525541 [Diaporthaceae sp. PMI_573]
MPRGAYDVSATNNPRPKPNLSKVQLGSSNIGEGSVSFKSKRKLQAKMAPKLNSGTADPQIIAWATRREENHEEHEPIVAALMDAGADPTIMDCNGNTAITMASKPGHERIIEMLNGRHNETDAVPTA